MSQQVAFTIQQKKLWVDIVFAAQEDDRMRCRTLFEKYVRKYPKLVGFGLLYGHLVAEDCINRTHPLAAVDVTALESLATTLSNRMVSFSPLLSPEKCADLLKVSVGATLHDPTSTSNEMLLILILNAALVSYGRDQVVAALTRVETKVRTEFGTTT